MDGAGARPHLGVSLEPDGGETGPAAEGERDRSDRAAPDHRNVDVVVHKHSFVFYTVRIEERTATVSATVADPALLRKSYIGMTVIGKSNNVG
jgi:hypothetical protein